MNPRHLCESKLLGTLLAAVMAAACGVSDDMLAPDEGRIRFVIGADAGPAVLASSAASSGPGSDGDGTDNSGPGNADDRPGGEHGDRAFPLIEAANVTFASVLARNLDGVLENVEMDLPVTVDVVTLDRGRQIALPDGVLPEGTYDQVVVVMTAVHLVFKDDTEVTIDPPGGGWTAIVALCPPVEVAGSGTPTVTLTLDVRNAVLMNAGRFHFQPRFKHPFRCIEVTDSTTM
jgi:hypothetical protein